MTSELTKQLQAECEKLQHRQHHSKADEYRRLDALWTEAAIRLRRSRYADQCAALGIAPDFGVLIGCEPNAEVSDGER